MVLTKISVGERRAALMNPALGCVTTGTDESDCSQSTTAPSHLSLVVYKNECTSMLTYVLLFPSFFGILVCIILEYNKMETVRGNGILIFKFGIKQKLQSSS